MRLDDDKIGRMSFWTPPTDENRAIRKVEAENLSNDSAIWVTSPWKPSYLGYIGYKVHTLGFLASIPVVLAAWAPTGVFTLLGVATLLHLEDG